MEVLLQYSCKSALALALLYLPYLLLLRKETFFWLNRAILLLVIVLSLTLPLLNVPILAWDAISFASFGQQAHAVEELPVDYTMVDAEVVVYAKAMQDGLSWTTMAAYIYAAGMVGLLIWRLLQIIQLRKQIRQGCLWQQNDEGITIHCHAEEVAPYSWMHHIVISEKDYREHAQEILLHETGHIHLKHSWDLLLLALLQAVQWWNPLVYLLTKSIRDVHEFEADHYALCHGAAIRPYQQLLIRKIVIAQSYLLANNFFHSLIYKRIRMMQQTKSSAWMCCKIIYLIPAIGLALIAFATPSAVSPLYTEGELLVDTAEVTIPSVALPNNASSNLPIVYMVDGQVWSEKDFKNFQPERIAAITVVYNQELAKEMGHEGHCIIVIKTEEAQQAAQQTAQPTNKDEKALLQDVKIVLKQNKEAIEKSQDVKIVLKQNKEAIENKEADTPAQYPGGEKALIQDINKAVVYPPTAIAQRVKGQVVVRFMVQTDGKVGKIEVAKSLSKECDKAAIDAVKKLKTFKPAIEKGKPVNTWCTIPILFKLQ